MPKINKMFQSKWFHLTNVLSGQLNLRNTILSGQCFNWFSIEKLVSIKYPDVAENNSRGILIGILNGKIIGLKAGQTNLTANNPRIKIEFCIWTSAEPSLNYLKAVKIYLLEYLQLENFDLVKETLKWQDKDSAFGKISNQFSGIRVLRQEPFECFISYICSQNNNFVRIQKILLKLREIYGKCLGEANIICGQKNYPIYLYDFPTLDEFLKKANLVELQSDCGLGYRAAYLISAVETLKEKGGEKWLKKLQGRPADEVQKKLCEFKGIGKKVADCIALFSLQVPEAIGIDTHVLQITKKYYPQSLNKAKSLTPKVYDNVSDFYRNKFGRYAGWAANILFTANRSLKKGNYKSDKSSSKIVD